MLEQKIPGFLKVQKRRDEAVRSLLKSLKHFSREKQFAILTSFIDVDRLEKIAAFVKREY